MTKIHENEESLNPILVRCPNCFFVFMPKPNLLDSSDNPEKITCPNCENWFDIEHDHIPDEWQSWRNPIKLSKSNRNSVEFLSKAEGDTSDETHS